MVRLFSVTVCDSQFSLSLKTESQHTGGRMFAVTKSVCFLHEHNTKTSFSLCTDILILLMAMKQLTLHSYIHNQLIVRMSFSQKHYRWTYSRVAHKRNSVVRTCDFHSKSLINACSSFYWVACYLNVWVACLYMRFRKDVSCSSEVELVYCHKMK